jgi:hypothetical protein
MRKRKLSVSSREGRSQHGSWQNGKNPGADAMAVRRCASAVNFGIAIAHARVAGEKMRFSRSVLGCYRHNGSEIIASGASSFAKLPANSAELGLRSSTTSLQHVPKSSQHL